MDAVFRIRRFILVAADRLSWLPPTLARVAIGVVFIGSGWGKLHNLDKITGFFTELGIPAPGFNAVLVSSAELVCGALILLGLLTRLASLPLIVVMTVAILTARRGEIGGLSDLLGFVETLYIVLLSWLATAGPGPLSLDRVALHALGGAAGPAETPGRTTPAHN
jgi:putative oxidoreductase